MIAVQDFFKGIGEQACYFISLYNASVELSSRYHSKWFQDLTANEIHDIINTLVNEELMVYHEDDYDHEDNFFILDSKKVMESLCGFEIDYQKLTPEQFDNVTFFSQTVVIKQYQWKQSHFVGAMGDTLQNSQTVKNGQLVYYRCFSHKY